MARLALLPIAALALNGCAAAALPALAGGAMVRSGGKAGGQAAPSAAEENLPETALAEAHEQSTGSGAGSPMRGEFASFARFARRQAASTRISSETLSATLLNPGMLDGERAQCNDLPPAVLIDLDREDQAFVPQDVHQSRPELAAELQKLRESNVSIGWISAANIDQMGAIRYALVDSKLDPDGEDHLLLMQHPDERKQSRRARFGKSHCIIAIAGDTMADFDELFLFLTNPDAARPLNAIVGDGWFITPLALTKK